MSNNALVIGATGLLGYGAAIELNAAGWRVRAIGKEDLPTSELFPRDIEYLCGDFYEESFLDQSLAGIDKVFYFLSSTFPSTSANSLNLEINRTLRGLDYLLRKMMENDVCEIVYPSSGGTVYGNVESGSAHEADALKPSTPYGFGKKMSEEVLDFYSSQGLAATVLRVGNVYGTPMKRTMNQGVIDIFIQKALAGEPATIWNGALGSVRDYIFLDDFSRGVAAISSHKPVGIEIYNLASGTGTALKDIIEIINKHVNRPLVLNYRSEGTVSNISRVVLDVYKFKEKTGWEPKYDIDAGIVKTIKLKSKE